MSSKGTSLLDGVANENWRAELRRRLAPEKLSELQTAIAAARAGGQQIFPPESLQFSAFDHTTPQDIRVVIIGQDPYHGEGQAHGLSFSVPTGVKVPPSLRNILKEVVDDVGRSQIIGGNLIPWAEQGVFLLNSCLSVEQGKAGSHRKLGWQYVTQEAVCIVSELSPASVFLLWGKDAQTLEAYVDQSKHLVLTSVHPSPLSAYRGFLGCKHFSKANQFLKDKNRGQIEW